MTGLALALAACGACHANETAQAASTNRPNRAVSTQASLDFVVQVGKFVYLRVGNLGTGINTVSFSGTAAVPAGPTAPVNGANQPVNWSGAAPTITFAPVGSPVLPVEVRSNAGQVTLAAAVDSALSNGTSIIPMSQITIASNNGGLPPPVLPAAGIGTAVNLAGTSFGNLVTAQAANWTFGYSNSVPVAAGSYNGRISFTASVP